MEYILAFLVLQFENISTVYMQIVYNYTLQTVGIISKQFAPL